MRIRDWSSDVCSSDLDRCILGVPAVQSRLRGAAARASREDPRRLSAPGGSLLRRGALGVPRAADIADLRAPADLTFLYRHAVRVAPTGAPRRPDRTRAAEVRSATRTYAAPAHASLPT